MTSDLSANLENTGSGTDLSGELSEVGLSGSSQAPALDLAAFGLQAATRMAAGAGGAVQLPAGVSLDDIKVVGRDLVITLPDGGQMIIPDGAIYVPQLVIGNVEVPALNLAALLIGQDPAPAAGRPESSGGNFAVPVGNIGDGIGLGDLLPPTALAFGTPEFEEIFPAVDDDDEPGIVIITPDQPSGATSASATVSEAALPARGSEPAGSNPGSTAETTTGSIVVTADDSPSVVTVNGVAITAVGQTITTAIGTLTITSIVDGTIGYSYTLADNTSGDSVADVFTVAVTDVDGDVAQATLTIRVADDVPAANDDAAALAEGGPLSVTVDVDTNDVSGADGTASRTFASLTGTYGNLTLNADGTQTYTLNAAGQLAINALAPGATLTDTFGYTLTDGDGDSDPATLVVTLTGTDDPVTITNLTSAASGGDVSVDEDDLPAGSDPSKEPLTQGGTFTIAAPDGVDDLSIGGQAVIVNGVFTPVTFTTPLGNTMAVTGYNAATGTISYTFTLNAAEAHAGAAGENSLFEDLTVTLTDVDGDSASGTLSANIVDDVPTANDDVAALAEGGSSSVTLDVDTNDVPGADGTGSRTFTSLTGVYGNLTLNADGTQTYALNAAGQLAIDALPPGATLTDSFSYTLTDGDGDSDPATLTVTLTGTDDPVIITDLTPAGNGGDVTVDEDDLPAGSDAAKESLTQGGTFTISAPDGVDDLSVGGQAVIVNGVFTAVSFTTPLGNTMSITAYNAATGVLTYSYTLNAAEAHANGAGENSLFEDLTVALTDVDGDTSSATLSANIVDDVPTANDDAAALTEGGPSSVTLDVDTNDLAGADGAASRTFTSLTGVYGNLVLNGDGTQTYTLNAAGQLAIDALPPGATLTDTFSYTLTDGDGDSDPAILTVTLTGTDDPVIITGLTPAANGGDVAVDEDDLPAGSDTAKESLTQGGTFTIAAPDGVDDLSVGGQAVIVNGVFTAVSFTTPLGNTMSITAYNAATGELSYSYTLNAAEAHANGAGENSLFEDLTVSLTDVDGDSDSATLSVNIVDDVPTANDDVAGLTEGGPSSVTLDVDTNDVPGADGTASRTFTSLTGVYGNLVLNGDGTQTYALNAAGQLAIDALPPGATLTDTFSYTLADGDGDSDPATLTVTLTGTDDPVIITGLTPAANGGDVTVDEDDLPAGSDAAKESLTQSGTFTISAPDGVDDLVIGGQAVITNGVFTAVSFTTPLGNTMSITAYNAVAGVLTYSYTLNAAETHANGAGENSLFEDLSVTLTDVDGDSANSTLSVNIVDDVPTANDDVAALSEGGPSSVTLDVDTNDVPGADGAASRSFASLTGVYGNLTLNGDGTQTYTLNAIGQLAIDALPPGVTLTDTFSYTLTDGDNDSDTADLVVTLNGTDDPVIITDLTPKANGGDVTVDEDDLPAGSDAAKESLTQGGAFTISAPDGVDDVSVGGQAVIANGVFTAVSFTTPLGNTMSITAYNAATGVLTYSYTLNAAETHANAAGENSLFEDLTVSLTDVDGDSTSGTLSVNIVDDVPTANDDAAALAEGGPSSVTFDVDTNDVPGADGTASRSFTSLTGIYGNLTLNGDGTQTYTLNAIGQIVVDALPPGVTLTDTFSYTLTDADGDSDPATLTVTLSGTDDPVVISGLTPKANGGDVIVDEDDLPAGTDTAKESLTQPGTFTISAPDGVDDVTVGGQAVITNGVFTAVSFTTPLGNTMSITAYNAATGELSYTYTLNAAETHPNAGGENSLFEDLTVTLTDVDGDSANATLSVNIVDDVPSLSAAAGAAGELTVDESNLALDDTANFAGLFTPNYGADGPGSIGNYTLGINAGSTGLVDTASGLAVVLSVAGGQVIGTAGVGGAVVLTLSVNASGVVTLDQQRAVVHADTSNHNDSVGLAAANLVTLSATVTDADGDSASATANIGGSITFYDDGPAIDASVTDANTVRLTTQDAQTIDTASDSDVSTANFGSAFTLASSSYGADGAGTTVWNYVLTLAVTQGSDSGLDSNGVQINLFNDGGTIVGSTATTLGTVNSTNTIFSLSVAPATGVVTLTQYAEIDHAPNGDTSAPYDDQFAVLANGLVNLSGTATITDRDGDSASETVALDMGGNVRFADDGPSIAAAGAVPTLLVDETSLAVDATVSAASLFTSSFGADGPGGATTYALNIAAGSTGLTDTATGEAVVLVLNGGVVEGRTASTNALVFTVTADASGNVTLDQKRAIAHDLDDSTPAAHDDPATLSAANLVTLTATVTDGDGDSATATINLGDKLVFEDDGPIANDENAVTTEVARDLNTAFVLDFSGSISNAELDVQLDAVKAAGQELFNGTSGDVTIRIVAFSGTATSYGPFTTYAAFAAQIDALNPAVPGGARPFNGQTDFTAAIEELLDVYAADPTASNQVFFLSDGNPNEQLGPGGASLAAPTASAWNTFVDSNGVNVTAIGVGNGINNARLQDIDVDGQGAPILVDNFDDLIDALLAVINAPAISGNVLANDSFGADGGRILSISFDGETYTWNGATTIAVTDTVTGNPIATLSGNSISVDTNLGGHINFNFATGAWNYAPPSSIATTSNELFNYVLLDRDGDTDPATLTITVNNDNAPTTSPVAATLDDDGIAGGNPGGTGDFAGVGNEAIVTGTLGVAYGPDGIGTMSFAGMQGLTATVGTETVVYSWSNVTDTLTATIDSGSRAGIILFTVEITNTNTGAYTVKLLDNVRHAAGGNENDAGPVVLTYKAGDANGTTTPGTLSLTFDDDTPTLGTIQNGFANNDPGAAHSFGTLHLSGGADGGLSVANVNGITSGNYAVLAGLTTASGNDNVIVRLSGNVLTAYQDYDNDGVLDGNEDDTEDRIFTLTLNPTTGPSGQWDFNLLQAVNGTVAGTNLNFSVTFTDVDGDPVSGSFTINVKDGNTPSAAIPPIVLDLDGDGLEFIGAGAGVAFDFDGDGVATPTAWVGPDDGLLAIDRNGDGVVNDGSEIVFGRNGQTDLEGLRADYDSNRDGMLTSADADFARFGVWQDANSNGVTDAGEFRSLSELGIASLNLTSDGISYTAAGGDVVVHGESSYTKTDGSSGTVADASFATGGPAGKPADQTQKLAAQNSSGQILSNALVAAGLVATIGASTHPDAKPAVSTDPAGPSLAPGTPATDQPGDVLSRPSGETREAISGLPDANDGAGPSRNSGSEVDRDAGGVNGSSGSAPAEVPHLSDLLADAVQGPGAGSAHTPPSVAMAAMPALPQGPGGTGAGADAGAANVPADQLAGILTDALGRSHGGADITAVLDALPNAESHVATQAMTGQGGGDFVGLESSAFMSMPLDLTAMMHDAAVATAHA
jgi:VCBS repeat-containing protein